MQTVLGAGGPIANIIARSLPDYCERIRLVSRNPKAVNRGDALFAADLLQPKLVDAAVAGSEVVYLCPGLLYKSSVWEQQWPVVMQNTINSCEKFGARLVFFDNVYAYGRVDGEMTESTPFNPCSRKGEVRAKIATQLLDAMQQGRVEALIARSADFYGPATPLCHAHLFGVRQSQQRQRHAVDDPHRPAPQLYLYPRRRTGHRPARQYPRRFRTNLASAYRPSTLDPGTVYRRSTTRLRTYRQTHGFGQRHDESTVVVYTHLA